MMNNTNIPIEIIRVRDKNEITIPKKVREILGVEPGDWVQFESDNDSGIVIHKIKPVKLLNGGGRMEHNTGIGGEDEIKKV